MPRATKTVASAPPKKSGGQKGGGKGRGRGKAAAGDGETPMMAQYNAMKARHPEHLLLCRMGDFFETFDDDAVRAAEILGITLTKRGTRGKDGPDIPLAGIPHHALDNYLAKLLRAGVKVAIAEQVEDPKEAKGLVKRDVVRLVTPGTIWEDDLLDERRANWLVALWREEAPAKTTPEKVTEKQGYGRRPEHWGLAAADIASGRLRMAEFEGRRARRDLLDELARLAPAEVLLPEEFELPIGEVIPADLGATLSSAPRDDYRERSARDLLNRVLGVHDLGGFGAAHLDKAVRATGALLRYLELTQRREVLLFNEIEVAEQQRRMTLDVTTQRSLELTEPLHHEARGARSNATLLAVIDETRTAMGSRLLREWLLEPLREKETIEARLDAVEAVYHNEEAHTALAEALRVIADLERAAARLALGQGSPRDLAALRTALGQLGEVLHACAALEADASLMAVLGEAIREARDELAPLQEKLQAGLVEAPPNTIKEGGLIRDGYLPQLDELRSVTRDSKSWIARMRAEEARRTGIESLKIGYNKVFGYFIEITKAQLAKTPAPDEYIRKQTLANAERYITPALKEKEEIILTAEEKANALEERVFLELREEAASRYRELHALSRALATLDVLQGLAETALKREYVRPEIAEDGALEIEEGRHPVLEVLAPDPNQPFVPNNTKLQHAGESENHPGRMMLITGPNMGGKSTYIRQVALIALMAQMGGFVPAARAKIGLVDRIFTRVGAMDQLARGQSTFLVEMSETANILNNCTDDSLVILDEIGRGTATYDGLSIAWAVLEYLHGKKGRRPRTLFATHYHELTELEDHLADLKNYSVATREEGGKISFLYRIVDDAADRSYGIYAARLAGVPKSVIKRAEEIMSALESERSVEVQGGAAGSRSSSHSPAVASTGGMQLTLFGAGPPHPAIEKLKKIDPNNLTPLEALQALAELKKLSEDK